MLVTVSTTCIIFMVAAFHMRRNDHAWPGVVLWKGEGNHEHLLIACISEQSQEVCEIFLHTLQFYLYKVKPGTESLSQAFSFSLSQFCQLQRKRFCLLQTSFSLYITELNYSWKRNK